MASGLRIVGETRRSTSNFTRIRWMALTTCGLPFLAMSARGRTSSLMSPTRLRFPRQWKIYDGQLEEFAGQTRIETVAWIDPGTVGEMKYNRIHTVEQLANMSDSSMDQANMLFLRKFRERAKKHLEETAASSGYDELKAQNVDASEADSRGS